MQYICRKINVMDKIIGLGNALVDALYKLDNDLILQKLDLPKGSMQLISDEKKIEIEEKLFGVDRKLSTGGSAANTIFALSRLGATVGFVGKVGDDIIGEFFKLRLESFGVEDRMLKTSEKKSGVALTLISNDGERTFGTYLGASSEIMPEEISSESFKGYSYLFIEGYLVQDHDLIIRAMEIAKSVGMQVCLDMASYNIVNENKELFQLLINKYVDIVFANEEEAKAFSGKSGKGALEVLGSKCSIAVVKMGPKGSFVRKGTEVLEVEAVEVKDVVDTTGAGDYYAAGFMYGITCGYSLEKCAKIGSLLASNVIGTVGTSLPDDVWECIKQKIDAISNE